MHINIEFKARCSDLDKVRTILKNKNADFKGTDNQEDIYFSVPKGRLKLRKGDIENSLIGYEREDYAGAKQSNVGLFKTEPKSNLEPILTQALGVKVTVRKKREIYFIDNVKIHLDEVEGLGTFVEVEAIDLDGSIGKPKLEEQCNDYKKLFGISQEDMIDKSYSDLLLA